MPVRERCSCGAEFESDEPSAMRQVREWRRDHKHEFAEPDMISSSIDAQVETALDNRTPELHIGFRPSEYDN